VWINDDNMQNGAPVIRLRFNTNSRSCALAAQLTWLVNRQILNLPEHRRHDPFMKRNQMARLILPNSTNVTCRVIDLSASGATIANACDLGPAMGTAVAIGTTPGRLVRHIDDGFAIEFTRLQRPDSIENNVTSE
jgi:hypothetical protein